jgi:uncharacterized RDD family membrane protein YckC
MTSGLAAGGTSWVDQGRPAGIVSRGLTVAVDTVVILGVEALAYACLLAFRVVWSPEPFTAPTAGATVLVGSTALFSVAYLTAGWAIAGRTYGAAVLGVRLVDSGGHVPGWGRCAVRGVCCVAFPLGLLWSAFRSDRRSLQDLLVRTNVVYDWH